MNIEGRRIGTKALAEAFNDNEEAERRMKAAIGSERLRHALLETMGIDPGPFVFPSLPKPAQIVVVREPHSPIADIQRAVAAHYNISPIHMKSAQRSRVVSHPRQIAMYLASDLTKASLVEIGRRFGGRDHTTVIHAIRAVAERCDSDPKTAADIAALRESLEP